MREKKPAPNISLSKYTSSTLMTCLQKAIDGEEYEEAVIYRDELRKRTQRTA
jgi:protein-arginine kinase activator protein McsA